MKSQPRRCTAIKRSLQFLFALAFLWQAALAWAGQIAGTVVNLSGPLLARKPDGAVKVLSLKSSVEQGDTLVTEKNTYARIKFTDNSEVTLKPGTQFKIENFDFDEAKPEGDQARFNLIKGGLRAVTGTLGKRNKEKVGFNTPTATIGIRGTTFIAEYIVPDNERRVGYGMPGVNASNSSGTMTDPAGKAIPPGQPPQQEQPAQQKQGLPLPPSNPAAPALPPGLHVQVIDGMIIVSNPGGSQGFTAGQFGYVPNIQQPPVLVPSNPGIQFTPPPAFNNTLPGLVSKDGPAQSGNVDCEVR